MRSREPTFYGEVGEIPHRVVVARVLVVDQVHPRAGVEEVLAQWVAVRRHERDGRGLEHTTGIVGPPHKRPVAVRECRALRGEERAVVVDHGEQLEVRRERGRGRVELADHPTGASDGVRICREPWRVHRDGAWHVAGHHQPVGRIEVLDGGIDVGRRSRPSRDLFSHTVDVLGGAIAGDTDDVVTDEVVPVGQAPEANRHRRVGVTQDRDSRKIWAQTHCLSIGDHDRRRSPAGS